MCEVCRLVIRMVDDEVLIESVGNGHNGWGLGV